MNRRVAIASGFTLATLVGALYWMRSINEKKVSELEKDEQGFYTAVQLLNEEGAKVRYQEGLKEIQRYANAPKEYQSDGSSLGDFLQEYTPDFPEELVQRQLARWNSVFFTPKSPETINSLYVDLLGARYEIIANAKEVRSLLDQMAEANKNKDIEGMRKLANEIKPALSRARRGMEIDILIKKYLNEREAPLFKKMYMQND